MSHRQSPVGGYVVFLLAAAVIVWFVRTDAKTQKQLLGQARVVADQARHKAAELIDAPSSSAAEPAVPVKEPLPQQSTTPQSAVTTQPVSATSATVTTTAATVPSTALPATTAPPTIPTPVASTTTEPLPSAPAPSGSGSGGGGGTASIGDRYDNQFSHGDEWLSTDAATAFLAAERELKAQGISIDLLSAGRTYEHQVYLSEHAGEPGISTVVAIPGTSEHETGNAVDIGNSDNLQVRRTLNEHGFKWGNRFGDNKGIPNDPSHFTYVGGKVV